jgi:hypothetical protein
MMTLNAKTGEIITMVVVTTSPMNSIMRSGLSTNRLGFAVHLFRAVDE